jgi:hypothetical protein
MFLMMGSKTSTNAFDVLSNQLNNLDSLHPDIKFERRTKFLQDYVVTRVTISNIDGEKVSISFGKFLSPIFLLYDEKELEKDPIYIFKQSVQHEDYKTMLEKMLSKAYKNTNEFVEDELELQRFQNFFTDSWYKTFCKIVRPFCNFNANQYEEEISKYRFLKACFDYGNRFFTHLPESQIFKDADKKYQLLVGEGSDIHECIDLTAYISYLYSRLISAKENEFESKKRTQSLLTKIS